MSATFTITLDEFLFPSDLDNSKANFRFVVDLRYLNEEGKFATEHAVMPSLDTFWECDTGKKDKPNYVRLPAAEGAGDKDGTAVQTETCARCQRDMEYSVLDSGKIDEWDKLVLKVRGEELHAIQIKVIDVDRKDAWDEVKSVIGGVAQVLVGAVNRILGLSLGPASEDAAGALPKAAVVPDSLGGAADDVRSFTLKRLAGGDDVLYRGSSTLDTRGNKESEDCSFECCGKDGCYKFKLKWTKLLKAKVSSTVEG
ncbi:MAG: hypothetical protein F4Y17_02245 [Gemmatimonadetes bacterium]|nr:hypothetical protein [Gemmatimonadota bacterium]